MDKAVGAGRADGLFVEALGIELAAFEARDLGADQRGAVLEILRAILRPHLELAVVGGQRLDMLLARSPAGAASQERGSGQRGVEMIFRRLEDDGDVHSSRCAFAAASMADSIVAGKEARLQLADPVPALGDRQVRIALQMALDPSLVELAHR